MIEALLKGVTLGFLLSISVGPIIFTIIKQSITNGLKGGFAFIIGVSVSDIFLAVAANFFTELLTSLDRHRAAIGIVGSTFLISVGIYFLFFKKVKVNEEGKQIVTFRKRDYAKIFLAGFFMNILNPGIIIFWITTATAFADHALQQRFLIFTIALVLVLVTDILKVLLANKIRTKLTLKNIHLVNRLNGVVLIVFGIILLWGLTTYSGKIGGH